MTIVGCGIVGLATAAAIAERRLHVLLIGESRLGEASRAAAGMLAPQAEGLPRAVREFAVAARDRFPDYIGRLRAATGIDVQLDRSGIIELEPPDGPDNSIPAERHGSAWLDPQSLARLEPALADQHGAGAWLHAGDGFVDNVALLSALETAVRATPRIRHIADSVEAIELGDSHTVALTRGGTRHESGMLVLAGGAWSPALRGLPRTIRIEPVRGQMIALRGAPIGHVVFGHDGYIVPRGRGRSIVGSTMERVGFDSTTTERGVASLRTMAASICPALARAPRIDAWAGLRPVTPDMLPMLGPDPAAARLLYACGHSRNGILLAPITAECIAALATGERPPADLAPFRPDRFDATGNWSRPASLGADA
ncbi:MAG: NAD(P)/FAD-dependent oxidoreductase [Gemmatimonadaceae bacterium]